MEKIRDEVNRVKRGHKTFAVILSDIDHFKKINDTYGHECGDTVLVSIAQRIKKAIRTQDVLARWGGEEFLFFLPETDEVGAAKLAEKIRKLLQSSSIQYNEKELVVTMTFGVTIFNPEFDIDNMINKADKALYSGKSSGKNMVVTYSSISTKE